MELNMIIKPQKGDKWSREEMILVFNLYFKIPYRTFTNRNPEVISLANLMGRTPSSIALRLSNFASCDPLLQGRGIKGMDAHKKKCQIYWDEFFENKERLVFESEQILSKYQDTTIEHKYDDILSNIPKDIKGESRLKEVKTRVNQNFFRKMVLANYDNKCALTGIDIKELLIASHIIPWSVNDKERLNPENGICLSTLYDKAFDCGLISFDDDYKLIFSKELQSNMDKVYYNKYFDSIKHNKLIIPNKYKPNTKFLEWHRDTILKK